MMRPPLHYAVSVNLYEGRAAQAIQRLKYERVTSLADPMARSLTACADRYALSPDIIVPVPIHWRRLCQRGFNQAELLAAHLPEPQVKNSELMRVRATPPQARLSLEDRSVNLKGAFSAGSGVTGMHVLLVDDVTTSGFTAIECAKALVAAGAVRVGLLTYASGG